MNNANGPLNFSNYSQNCASCKTLQIFVSHDGRPLKSCKTCRDNGRTTYDLDEHYDTHEEFTETVSSLLKQHDDHKFNLAAQSLKIRTALSANILFIETDVSMATLCTNCHDGAPREMTKSNSASSVQTERDPLCIQRYKYVIRLPKEFFDCHGQLHIILSKDNGSAVIVYEHRCQLKHHKFHVTDEVRSSI
ncbi:uncharacterized protein V1513DRAFT_444467 [Lipomyces chichibuensis]|uniref:uncharacterized protein n=1 Tax=Lipomyces chichibuensis TaxID=1546026 RepID=UPI0033434306